jgi:hypothetical protein
LVSKARGEIGAVRSAGEIDAAVTRQRDRGARETAAACGKQVTTVAAEIGGSE